MKRDIRIYLLYVIVLAQLVWLGWNYGDRVREVESSPVLHVSCSNYDPRDLLRGDYVMLDVTQTFPLEKVGASFFWTEALCHAVNHSTLYVAETRKEYAVSNPLQPRAATGNVPVEIRSYASDLRVAVFWKKGEDALHQIARVEVPGSSADVAQEGERRIEMWASLRRRAEYVAESDTAELRVDLRLRFSKNNSFLRYYVEEKSGDLDRIWYEELKHTWNAFPDIRVHRTVELVLRKDAAPIPRMVYLNGIPYPEAVEKIRNRTFPWLKEALPE